MVIFLTKGQYMGFKVKVVLNEENMAPVSILIYPVPYWFQNFWEVLQYNHKDE